MAPQWFHLLRGFAAKPLEKIHVEVIGEDGLCLSCNALVIYIR